MRLKSSAKVRVSVPSFSLFHFSVYITGENYGGKLPQVFQSKAYKMDTVCFFARLKMELYEFPYLISGMDSGRGSIGTVKISLNCEGTSLASHQIEKNLSSLITGFRSLDKRVVLGHINQHPVS